MPTDTADQQITLPVGADSADNPVTFVNTIADVESRLVRSYTNEADRTARMLSLSENAISTLASENRAEIYSGVNHISLYTRSLFGFAYKAASQTMTPSNTTPQNVTDLVVAMPAAGTFSFRGIIYYDSSIVADVKFAFTTAVAAVLRWNGNGVVVGSGTTGDGTFNTVTGSGATLSFGGAGAGTVNCVQLEGEYVAAGNAGNFQFQASQNTSEASNTIIIARSRFEVWRHI